MTRHQVTAGVLVVTLGSALHFAFKGLAGELPLIFPSMDRETPGESAPPLALISDEEENFQAAVRPPRTRPIEPSGDIPLTVKEGGPEMRAARKLVRSTPLPSITLPEGPSVKVGASFEIPHALAPIVDFWRKVYALYDNQHVILHDMDFLDIQYVVLDFTELNRKSRSDAEKKIVRDAEVRREMGRIKDLLGDLDASQGVASSKEGLRIAALFAGIRDPDKFKKARDRVRSQTGLKNRFQEGLQRSGRYMPYFEQIFQTYGVPREITRLVFVESLFKERSLSKVGAAGLWQFMAGSAKKYITVDPLIDERYDPIAATHAAARLLSRNYELLGSWPLAINAYNSGAGNLLKAISKLGTKDIAAIVTQYKTGSYAFASRNFYPSFLAALDTYENQQKYFGSVKKDPLFDFDVLQLPETLNFPEIALLADVSLAALKDLNPAYDGEVFSGKYSMPAGSQVRIPKGSQKRFASRFVNFNPGAAPSELYMVKVDGSPKTILPE